MSGYTSASKDILIARLMDSGLSRKQAVLTLSAVTLGLITAVRELKATDNYTDEVVLRLDTAFSGVLEMAKEDGCLKTGKLG